MVYTLEGTSRQADPREGYYVLVSLGALPVLAPLDVCMRETGDVACPLAGETGAQTTLVIAASDQGHALRSASDEDVSVHVRVHRVQQGVAVCTVIVAEIDGRVHRGVAEVSTARLCFHE